MSKSEIRKRLRECDWLIFGSFALMLLVKFFTIFLYVQIHQETGAEIESIVTTYEASSIYRMGLMMGKASTVITIIILPAGAIAFYFYARRRVLTGKVDIDTLIFFVQFAFFSLLINVLNDGAALFGKIWRVI